MVGSKVQQSIDSLMKRTEPSVKATFTPPGWKLDAAIDERACLVDRQEIVKLLLGVDRVEVGVFRVAEVARGPPVPAIEAAVGLGEQPVSDLAEGGRVTGAVGDCGDPHGRAVDNPRGWGCSASPAPP